MTGTDKLGGHVRFSCPSSRAVASKYQEKNMAYVKDFERDHDEPLVRFRRRRRKCCYCGQWIKKGEQAVDEAHFAHANCQRKANKEIKEGMKNDRPK